MALLRSGIDDRFKGKWLGKEKAASDEQETFRFHLRDVMYYRKAWCLLVGGTKGNGKSYMAQVAVNTFNDDDFNGGLYTTQPLLEAELRIDGSRTFLKYANAPFLVMDELSDRPNDWTEYIKTNIESILIERHRQNNPTVIIGNVDLKRMNAMFDVRVRDRLKEGIVFAMTGPSLRRAYGS